MPTRKWIAAQITAIVGLALMLLTGDATVTDPEKVAIGTWLVQAATTWLIPNESTPTGDGVPARRSGIAGLTVVELLLILIFAVLVIALVVGWNL